MYRREGRRPRDRSRLLSAGQGLRTGPSVESRGYQSDGLEQGRRRAHLSPPEVTADFCGDLREEEQKIVWPPGPRNCSSATPRASP